MDCELIMIFTKKIMFFLFTVLTILLCSCCGCDTTDVDTNTKSTVVQTEETTLQDNSKASVTSNASSNESSNTESKTDNTSQTSAEDVLGMFDSDQVEDE